MKNSDEFEKEIIKAPTNANWISKRTKNLEKFVEFANDSYPILHERVVILCNDFLQFMRENGSQMEKEFYKNLSLLQLIDRLIKKVSVFILLEIVIYLICSEFSKRYI